MATKKEIVKISDITKFGNSLAKSIRARLRAVTKKLGGSGMVKLTNGTSRDGQAKITIVIGEGKKDPTSPTQPITGLLGAVEYGAEPHVISPRTKQTLAFFWPKATRPIRRGGKILGTTMDGKILFSYVDHPGMKGYHPIRDAVAATREKAVDELKLDIRKNIVEAMNITIREINRK